MYIVDDSILNTKKDIIVQQVNCQGKMGSGLAKQIAIKYPIVKHEYIKLCNICGTDQLLGSVQFIHVDGDTIVANIFGQDGYGRDRKYTLYPALRNGLEYIKAFAYENNLSIAIPYVIGGGLGGGSCNYILKMIKQVYEGSGLDVAMYKNR